MIGWKLAVLHDIVNALTDEEEQNKASLPFLQGLKELEDEALQIGAKKADTAKWIEMPFLHGGTPDIRTKWTLDDFDPAAPNDYPNMNIAVMGLILSANIEATVGEHAWSLVQKSLERLGFTNIMHRYFEEAERINHPAMVFARSTETVNGKTVVAAIYRGSASFVDIISDLKAEPHGFQGAGINAVNELKAYCSSQGLTKDNTMLFITGHSYGASCASLVGINSTDLAERDSIFCYSFATPNYNRNGLNGEGMKMFSFNSNEDVVPQVPVGPNLDKTGVSIGYDRLELQLRHPEKYARFLKLYRHFRDNDFDSDSDFIQAEYTFKPYVPFPVNEPILRNHMPYTYMPLILSELPDDEAYAYIVEVSEKAEEKALWSMSVGEVYKLPLTATGLFTWTSSDETVASVDDGGMLKGKAPGNTKLTITAPDGRNLSVTVHVSR